MSNAKQMELISNLLIKTNPLILKPIHEDYINTNFTQEVAKYMPINPNGDKIDIVNFVESSKKKLM